MKSACFTGHRPNKLPWREDEQSQDCLALKRRLELAIREAVTDGCTHFITGMAPGVDIYAAETVLQLRESCGITLECALPFMGHADGWNAPLRARHDDILRRANSVTTLASHYTPSCMDVRNRYMVQQSDRLIAVYGGGRGGTANTLRHALKAGLIVTVIDPFDLEE